MCDGLQGPNPGAVSAGIPTTGFPQERAACNPRAFHRPTSFHFPNRASGCQRAVGAAEETSSAGPPGLSSASRTARASNRAVDFMTPGQRRAISSWPRSASK